MVPTPCALGGALSALFTSRAVQGRVRVAVLLPCHNTLCGPETFDVGCRPEASFGDVDNHTPEGVCPIRADEVP